MPTTHIDSFWQFNLGNALTIVSVIITGLGLWTAHSRRLQRMETRLDIIYEWFMDTIVGSHGRGRAADGDD